MIEFFELLATFLAVVVVLTLHEFAHALTAYKCGDPTAKYAGRLSLNPMRHFDPLGLISFTLMGFGWAKPVPVNPYNFKKYTLGCFLTSAAGVLTNLVFAFLFYPILQLTFMYLLPNLEGTYAFYFFLELCLQLYTLSLSFCIFNLLPFYPLDGFNLVASLNKKRGKVFTFLQKYGQTILLGLILINLLSRYFYVLSYVNVLGYLMDFGFLIFGTPITAFWSLIFAL